MYNNPLQEALQRLNNMGKATKPSSISESKKKINESKFPITTVHRKDDYYGEYDIDLIDFEKFAKMVEEKLKDKVGNAKLSVELNDTKWSNPNGDRKTLTIKVFDDENSYTLYDRDIRDYNGYIKGNNYDIRDYNGYIKDNDYNEFYSVDGFVYYLLHGKRTNPKRDEYSFDEIAYVFDDAKEEGLKESANDQKIEARKIIKGKLPPVALGIYASLNQPNVTYTDWFESIMADDYNPDHNDDFYKKVFNFLHSKVWKIVEPVKEEIKEKFPTLTENDLRDLFVNEPLDEVDPHDDKLWNETDKFLKDTIKKYEESI